MISLSTAANRKYNSKKGYLILKMHDKPFTLSNNAIQ
jgi:hypothetical protein